MFYVVQTATGFVLLGFFTDLFAPFVAPLAHVDLMLPAMWGGIITGIGYGMVLRAGANTGGSDTIGQIISRNTSLPVGSTGNRRCRMCGIGSGLLARKCSVCRTFDDDQRLCDRRCGRWRQ